MLLMDGVVCTMYRDGATELQYLAPDRVYRLTIHLADIHHTFRAGNWLYISSTLSSFFLSGIDLKIPTALQ
jgi:predicted acyl esterase